MYAKLTILIISATIGILFIALLFGRMRLHLKFKKQVAALYGNAGNVSDKIYHSSQLYGLPEPVERYFRYALRDEQPYINSVRLKHIGSFKADLKKGFIPISGEQYFSVQPPQFIWKGSTTMFTARDSYIADYGNLKVSLLNLFTVVDAKGNEINEGELQRWLAESVWFPTNLLPSENVTWAAIDENAAKLSFRYKAIAFDFTVTFNALGEITAMETYRFMTDKNREKWLCKMANYKDVGNAKVPFSAEATWKLQTGDFTYAKFEVQEIKYNGFISKA